MAVDPASLPPSNGSMRAQGTRRHRVESVMRMRDVITLSVQGGYSDAEIAALLTEQYEKQGRKKITARAVASTRERALARHKPNPELVEQVRALQLQRLDELTAAAMPNAMQGNARSIDTVLKIEVMRSRIVGTEAPKKIEHGGSIGHVHEIADADEVARLEEAFKSSVDYDIDSDAVDDELLGLPVGDVEAA